MSVATISNIEVNTFLSAAIDAGLTMATPGGKRSRITRENAHAFGLQIKRENVLEVFGYYADRLTEDECQQLAEGLERYSFIYIAGVKPEALALLGNVIDYRTCVHRKAQTDALLTAASIWSDTRGTRQRDVDALPWGIRTPEDCLAMLRPVLPFEDIARRHPVITALFLIGFAAAFAGVLGTV